MPKFSFVRQGTTHSVEVSEDTHEILTDGAALRRRPVEYYLLCIVSVYGELTEENIRKYMDERWIL